MFNVIVDVIGLESRFLGRDAVGVLVWGLGPVLSGV